MHLVNLGVDKSTLNPYISNTLLSKIEEVISNGEKAILYLNKRGQFSSIVCNDCQHLFKCKNCDISMSVHKYPSKFICHLCSSQEEIPLQCSKCHGTNLSNIGIGTQQIEESLSQYFNPPSQPSPLQEEGVKQKNFPSPEGGGTKGGEKSYSIFRFDTDAMKTKKSKVEALESLNSADIIIGTKMITTGFNFKKVGLIGIILLEQELQIPKYNTEESVYTNTRQLLGRGGRIGQKTDFIIQSFIPDNDTVKAIVNDNYREFFIKTLEERKLFKYPPFGEIATLEYRHKSDQKALDFTTQLFNKLELELEDKKDIEIIFNKAATRKFNQYYYKIILKGENIRVALTLIKPEILRNSGLSINFD